MPKCRFEGFHSANARFRSLHFAADTGKPDARTSSHRNAAYPPSDLPRRRDVRREESNLWMLYSLLDTRRPQCQNVDWCCSPAKRSIPIATLFHRHPEAKRKKRNLSFSFVPGRSALNGFEQVRRPRIQSHGDSVQRLQTHLALPRLQFADVRLAEFGVSRQINLPPAALRPEFPNPSPQPDSDVACHASIVRLFSETGFRHT